MNSIKGLFIIPNLISSKTVVDFLNNLFRKKSSQMDKLRLMRNDEEIKNLLSTKFDREVLVQLLGVEKIDIDEILRNCNFSDTFIQKANDLQIMEAIN